MSEQDADAAVAEPQECSACRGTGKVISGLGGTPSPVTCPWCEGSGVFIPEHDAFVAGAKLRGEDPPPSRQSDSPEG